jgi:glyoxylase-like metal-dependent hydrolase (beta-lactamase superfamily II)
MTAAAPTLDLRQMPMGPLQTNCYLIGCRQTMQAAIVDPSWSGEKLARLVQEEGYTLTHILLTHAHFDHVGGLADLKGVLDVPVYAHPDSADLLRHAARAGAMFGVSVTPPPPADHPLRDGDTVQVGNLTLEALYTPGHAPGHLSFWLREQGVVLSGDALFQGGIGRTDLPGGDFATLMHAIRHKLLTLPDTTRVFSGHGPATTIGIERTTNPFIA